MHNRADPAKLGLNLALAWLLLGSCNIDYLPYPIPSNTTIISAKPHSDITEPSYCVVHITKSQKTNIINNQVNLSLLLPSFHPLHLATLYTIPCLGERNQLFLSLCNKWSLLLNMKSWVRMNHSWRMIRSMASWPAIQRKIRTRGFIGILLGFS